MSHPHIDPALINDLMQGAIDTHVHTLPALYTPGKLDDLELAKAAKEAGMAGYVSKSAEMPTMAHAMLAMKEVPTVHVYSSIVLNASVGGINPEAVQVALGLGARVVWLPTSSSETQRRRPGAKAPIVNVADDSGRLVPELYEVFALVKSAGAVLATGDISPMYGKLVAQQARGHGLEKVVITHPEAWVVEMPIQDQAELARLGCFIEHCYATFAPGSGSDAATVAHSIRTAGSASAMLATDFGKLAQPTPVEGLRAAIATMLAEGFPPAEVRRMVRGTPQALLAS